MNAPRLEVVHNRIAGDPPVLEQHAPAHFWHGARDLDAGIHRLGRGIHRDNEALVGLAVPADERFNCFPAGVDLHHFSRVGARQHVVHLRQLVGELPEAVPERRWFRGVVHAPEKQAAGATDDGVIGHEARLRERGVDRSLRAATSAGEIGPGEALEHHEDRLAVQHGEDVLARFVADHGNRLVG